MVRIYGKTVVVPFEVSILAFVGVAEKNKNIRYPMTRPEVRIGILSGISCKVRIARF
jgi:hypothetical protein